MRVPPPLLYSKSEQLAYMTILMLYRMVFVMAQDLDILTSKRVPVCTVSDSISEMFIREHVITRVSGMHLIVCL